jgi:hypothetical protein
MERPHGQTGTPAGPKVSGSRSHDDGGPTGAITLADSGLITRINRKAADLLGTRASEIRGKPFTLFVERSELAVFFSHWNRLLSTSENQLFEITLKGAAHKSQLECSVARDSSGKIETVKIVLAGKPDQAPAVESRVESLQDLPALIFAISSGISTADAKHLDRSIQDALRRIGLFAEADHCFIHTLNRSAKRMDPGCEWRRQPESGKNDVSGSKSVQLSKVQNVMSRLRREKIMTFHDAAGLGPAERHELLAWHGDDSRAGILYFIRSGNIPVGVVGVTWKYAQRECIPECEALVRFFGDFMAGRLVSSVQDTVKAEPPRGVNAAFVSPAPGTPERSGVLGGFKKKGSPSRAKTPEWETDLPAPQARSRPPGVERSMKFEPVEPSRGDKADLHLPVFPGDDWQVVLSCPHCGGQKSVTGKQLFALSTTIRVACPCSHRFTILLERRKFRRKNVRLEAVVTWVGDAESTADRPKTLGWMVIKDLSKGGLRLASVNARHIRPGDLLMVRFNLDNSSKTLIQRLVRVTSVNGDEIGCRFESADQQDTVLGFYLM